jgi:hypothetical protein
VAEVVAYLLTLLKALTGAVHDAAHHDVLHGTIGQVVALIQQTRLPLHDSGLLSFRQRP